MHRALPFLVMVLALGCEPVAPTAKNPAQTNSANAAARPEAQQKLAPAELVRVELPAANPQDQRLAVFLHGYGADEKDLPALARRMGLGGPVVSFRAPIALDRGGYAWFDRDLRRAPAPEKIARFEHSVARLVDELRRERATNPDREIIVAGFSQGAMIGGVIAAEHGDLIDRAVLLSGALPRELGEGPSERPKVFVSHGDADQLVPLSEGKELAMTLRKRGHDVELKVYPGMGHRILPAVIDDLKSWLAASN